MAVSKKRLKKILERMRKIAEERPEKKEEFILIPEKVEEKMPVKKLAYKPGKEEKKKEEKKKELGMPIVFEFPRLSEELKTSGVIPIQKLGKEEIRGLPTPLYALPEEERGKKISSEWVPIVPSTVSVRYPLIEPYAYTNINWSEKTKELKYILIEPPLTEKEKESLKRLEVMIIDLLDINLMAITEISEVKKYLEDKISQIISDYEIRLSKTEYDKILYYINRDFLGLGIIEPLMQDPNIEDVSCDGVEIPIFVFHRKYGSIKTNIFFKTEDELNSFVTKLAQRCRRHISVAEPLMDGALPDGSRVQATFSAGRDIATKGSTFTIRKFTKDPLTIIDFMNFGTIPATMAAYLWLAIEFRNSVLVSGGTATGKTCALNCLCLFLPPEAKIVSIEDTPELVLPHEHWIAKIARTGYGPSAPGVRRGEISMFDLLRAALRERPDELIVGEVRGSEAYVLFQGMASIPGHERVLVLDEKNNPHFEPIEKLCGKNLAGWKAVTIHPVTKKIEISPINACVKHWPRKELYEIETNTGRKVKVTGDHSVFTYKNKEIMPVFVEKLQKGSKIVVPGKMPAWLECDQFFEFSDFTKQNGGIVEKEIYVDSVKKIRKIVLEKPEPVYDLSVQETQNFIGGFGGIMLHNTGHAGMATIHAESMDAIINRLITPPIDLSPGLLQHLNLVMIMELARVKGVDVRRVKEVVEILGIDIKTGKPVTNQIFRWVPAGDYYEFASDRSYLLNKIVQEKGISEKSIWEELERRTAIFNWMKKEGIRYYKDVGQIIATYYKNPDEILKRVFGAKSEPVI